jgi:hypothetical protein
MVHNMHQLQQKYGPVVRIAPDEISFNSVTALRTIYGAGNGSERIKFYRIFDVYGRPNLFTFGAGKDHREGKKLLSYIYSNQTVLGPSAPEPVQAKVAAYLEMIEREPKNASEIFTSLQYSSFDTISEFVYGPGHGGTQALPALPASVSDRALLNDILHLSRRRLAWFAVHLPEYTKWITSQTGLMKDFVALLGLLPMRKPFICSGIRDHALKAFYSFKAVSADTKARHEGSIVIARLFKWQKEQGLTDMGIGSECADHLLAGIDATADSSMFLIWALSLP